jgi:hypothetical protein
MDLKETMDKRVAGGGGSPHLPRGGWRRFLASPLPYSKMAARRFELCGSRVERKTGKDFAHAPSSTAGTQNLRGTYVCIYVVLLHLFIKFTYIFFILLHLFIKF